MPNWYETLFYCVFLGQILLISFHYPERLRRRMVAVLEDYPPERYPRLYPKPVEVYRIGIWIFTFATRAIVVLGLLLLVALATVIDPAGFADDGFISEAWPAAFFMVQCLPFVVLGVTELSQLKLMRQAGTASRRRAELRRRRLVDFVSPAWLGLAALLFAGSIAFDLYLHDFDVSLGHDTMQRALTLLATNLLFVVAGAWQLYGRKPDPHQSPRDRAQRIGVELKAEVFASIAISVFFMLLAADDALHLDYLDATMISLYFQAIAFLSIGLSLRRLSLDDIDFDVYKADLATE